MHNLWYTRAYTNDMGRHEWHEDTGWFSEYVSDTYTVQDAMNDQIPFPYQLEHDDAKMNVQGGNRSVRYKHTAHTSIYDLDTYSLIVLSDEKADIYNFTLGETVYQNQIADLTDFLKVGRVSKQPRSLVFNNTESNIAGGSIVEKDCATAFGSGNKALGNSSFVIGQNNEARGDASIAMGKGSITTGDYQVVMGKYNELDTENKYLFIVGNGEYNNKKNIFAIGRDGNIYVQKGHTEIKEFEVN